MLSPTNRVVVVDSAGTISIWFLRQGNVEKMKGLAHSALTPVASASGSASLASRNTATHHALPGARLGSGAGSTLLRSSSREKGLDVEAFRSAMASRGLGADLALEVTLTLTLHSSPSPSPSHSL